MTQQAPGLAGNTNSPFGSTSSTFDEGSARVVATEKLDKLVLRLTNRAVDPTNATFQNGQQTWSLSLGDLRFKNEQVDPTLNATAIEWLSRKEQLSRPGYNNDTATTTALSKDGRARAALTLQHDQSTPNLTTYSKWEIDQWGDPTGEFFAPGSWQIVTDSANSVVLGLWGYWGGPGETAAIDDFTCYRIILDFDHPVHDLNLPMHGINGFLKPTSGFNSGDEVEVSATRYGLAVDSPTYTDKGRAIKQVGSRLVGDFAHQIDDGISGQHMSNDGSCQARFTEAVDRVVLTFINRAGHPDPVAFKTGMQTWSMALGDLTFTHRAPMLTNLSRQSGVTIFHSKRSHYSQSPERWQYQRKHLGPKSKSHRNRRRSVDPHRPRGDPQCERASSSGDASRKTTRSM